MTDATGEGAVAEPPPPPGNPTRELPTFNSQLPKPREPRNCKLRGWELGVDSGSRQLRIHLDVAVHSAEEVPLGAHVFVAAASELQGPGTVLVLRRSLELS